LDSCNNNGDTVSFSASYSKLQFKQTHKRIRLLQCFMHANFNDPTVLICCPKCRLACKNTAPNFNDYLELENCGWTCKI